MEMGSEHEERPQVNYRAGDEGETKVRFAYLLPWSECPVFSQGLSATDGSWDKSMSWGGRTFEGEVSM